MGPGFSDSSEEEEEKESAMKENTADSFAPEIPVISSKCRSDIKETEDNSAPPEQESTPSTTPLVPVNFQGFTSSKLLKSPKSKKRTIK
jgi:hypothetical protein